MVGVEERGELVERLGHSGEIFGEGVEAFGELGGMGPRPVLLTGGLPQEFGHLAHTSPEEAD